MIAFLRLIRPVNLLIIAFTMVAMRYGVIDTLIKPFDFELQFPLWKFVLLVFSVVCIAAAGNVINDYFDARIDSINKPESVIVGFGVPRRVAMVAHFIMSMMGIAIGAYLSWSIGKISLVGIHLFASATLWYYSTVFKRQLMLGNFVVALLAGLVPLTVSLFELPLLSMSYSATLITKFANSGIDPALYFRIIFFWVIGFSVFAFLLNLLREIVKDMADVKGDKEMGRETFPIILGYTYTNIILSTLSAITLGLLIWVYFSFINHSMSLAYFVGFYALPLLAANVLCWVAKDRKIYIWAGNLIKLVMLAGISYSFLIGKMLAES